MTRFGLQLPNFTLGVPDDQLFDRVVELAVTAEESGFASLWVMDHLYQLPALGGADQPMLEAYTLLGGLAARTSRAELGTMVTGVTYRNPALMAKITTTLDVLSGGRAIFGIGAAWFEDEHRAYGFDFPPLKERFERLEEALQIARAMFTEEAPSFEGTHYRIDGVLNNPRPVRGDIPILIGGSGERKTLRLVARYADGSNIFGGPDQIRHLLGVLGEHCVEAGRDPAEITKTRLGTLAIAPSHEEAERAIALWPDRLALPPERLQATLTVGDPDEVGERVRTLFDAGLDGLVFNMPNPWDLDAVALAGETLSRAAS